MSNEIIPVKEFKERVKKICAKHGVPADLVLYSFGISVDSGDTDIEQAEQP